MSQIIAKLTLTVTVLQLVRAGHGLSVNQVFGGYLGRGSEDTSTSEGETQVRAGKISCDGTNTMVTPVQGDCARASSGTGQCMFDLSCRLSYGHKVGDCGGFYQVRIFLQSTGCSS